MTMDNNKFNIVEFSKKAAKELLGREPTNEELATMAAFINTAVHQGRTEAFEIAMNGMRRLKKAEGLEND